ncbi:phage antirepressor KilAC domain-containing protein [Macrococcoides caseolyticum]|uniref:Anti-repressor homolog n=1 Tax=Macrococcus caseolyticus (strain JCSC5402) TaxID=458233 RepID=B9EBK3_MACCJ|nr:phage antirepressor KilAC domain-containing protein [Macrococcus caseolyticus]BAH17614.1 anti-repressor homolog [Macrococcus caseolyticus JCSC5402]
MNQLVPIREDENGEVVVNARTLHKELKVKTRFSLWVEQNFKHFKNGRDFTSVVSTTVVNNGAIRKLDDYALTLEMAKHISMMSGTEKGFEVREYFIQVEKHWNSPEMIMKRALQIADKKIISLEEKIALDKPKVLFADALTTSNSSILIGELAKLLKQNGVEIGQNKLFEWLRANGYLIRKKGELYNLPTQYSMDLGLMDIKKRVINNADGSTRTTRTTKVTGKGQQYFINKFLNSQVS